MVSIQSLLDSSRRSCKSQVVHMTGSEAPSRAARTIFSFNDLDSIREFKTGCDADIGGTSTVHFDLDESPAHATGRFWGEMSLRVQPGKEGKVRGGYAAIQSRVCPYTSCPNLAVCNPCC